MVAWVHASRGGSCIQLIHDEHPSTLGQNESTWPVLPTSDNSIPRSVASKLSFVVQQLSLLFNLNTPVAHLANVAIVVSTAKHKMILVGEKVSWSKEQW